MMTAYPTRETFARAKELGAIDILTKPFTASHIAGILGGLLPNGWSVDEAPLDKGRVLL